MTVNTVHFQKWGKATVNRLIKETFNYAKSAIQHELVDNYGLAANAIEQTIHVTTLSGSQNERLNTLKNLHANLMQAIQQDEFSNGQQDSTEHPNAQAIAQLGGTWFTAEDDHEKARILQERVSLDPVDKTSNLPMTLTQRLLANGIDIRSYHNYQPSSPALNLEHSNKQWLRPPAQALALLAEICNPHQKQILENLLQEERLRLMDYSSGASDFCIASLQGCFIQLTTNQGQVNMYDLLHEFGHYLHFGKQLDVWSTCTDLEQETAAVAFEISCLQHLEKRQPIEIINRSPALHTTDACLSNLRKYYYGDWLWRVHLFEVALHFEQIDCPKQLDSIWARIVGTSHGNWRQQSHLYIAPFYTVLYPFTLAKKDTTSTV